MIGLTMLQLMPMPMPIVTGCGGGKLPPITSILIIITGAFMGLCLLLMAAGMIAMEFDISERVEKIGTKVLSILFFLAVFFAIAGLTCGVIGV